ncbi:MAG: PP2C family protein-serine/threonine phosphatase [Vicinamibacterales bacterium]
MIRAVLVDDEAPARARLRALLAEIGDVDVVGEAADAQAGRALVSAAAPDVLFLDIEMPAERGTDFAASLPEPRPFIVFATAYERFAVDAFQYDAADYLLKPVNRGRLAATLDRLRRKLRTRRDDAREIEAATRAQAHLLPRRLPALEGYGLGARTLAARGVGGDFFDAVLVDGRLAFVVGDVAGKGMAAGLIASSVHARWQSAMHRAAEGAHDMMTALNRDVAATTEGSRYATLVHGVLDPPTGDVQFVNAGHPSALVVSATGGWTSGLAATAPAVGLLDVAEFVGGACRLASGDTLVLVSDGVTEALDAHGRELPLDTVAALAGTAGTDAQDVADAIVAAVRTHRGADQAQDDVTVFVLRRHA